LIVIDDKIAYIGGINFSEHNFAWHDLMLRIKVDDIATFFADDFRTSWEGKNVTIARQFDGIEFLMFDGYNNEALFEKIMSAISEATKEIWLESPYLSFPFVEKLKRARERGVEIKIVTPANNNKKSVQDYILYEAARCDFKIFLYRGCMTHLKAILIDNKKLILGSTNFDFLSYTMQQEIAALINNPEIVSDFIERVVKVDCANSDLFDGKVDIKAGMAMSKKLKSLGKLSVWLNRGHIPKLD
jgi:cardiolipin synthase